MQNSKLSFIEIGIVALFIAFFAAYSILAPKPKTLVQAQTPDIEAEVLPPDGIILPVVWGNVGKELIDSGAIDQQKFEALYANRGGLTDEEKQLLYGTSSSQLKITQENSQTLLNLLWAFGLANKNAILETGPMKQYGKTDMGNFASTGGWTLAKTNAMDYYSKFQFVTLTPEQQKLVENMSKGIYRPCCNNSTYFPDCNHGMAMLGLLELMASQGATESEMYKAALAVNSYWFPETYIAIATLFQSKGTAWSNVNPAEALSAAYSSASGYQNVLSQITPPNTNTKGGSCGV